MTTLATALQERNALRRENARLRAQTKALTQALKASDKLNALREKHDELRNEDRHRDADSLVPEMDHLQTVINAALSPLPFDAMRDPASGEPYYDGEPT